MPARNHLIHVGFLIDRGDRKAYNLQRVETAVPPDRAASVKCAAPRVAVVNPHQVLLGLCAGDAVGDVKID
jgi:hypothetical protein